MLQIYNTLTSKKEIFNPLTPNKIKLYICGVTVYDYCHLGHARTYTAFDTIVRFLKAIHYDVTYVRNITDIDDKIINRANENNELFTNLTDRFIKAMHNDFDSLNLLKPDQEPRATNFMPNMISMIEKMIHQKHAYIGKNGDVYFDIQSFKDYGCLSHHNLSQLESGARVLISEDKKDPLDFVLWKLAKAGEPAWISPWGNGRPGWHIECSAMSTHFLSEHFDIHGGGRDLIFPHHENELAQSKAANQQPFVNYWMHSGYLQMQKEKMSKSLGNFITIRDVLQKHSAESCRLFFISSHYRSPLMYTEDALHQAKQSLTRIYTAMRFLPEVEPIKDSQYELNFMNAMYDDFNTPLAISIIFDLVHEINRLKETKSEKVSPHAALLKKLANMLGLLQQPVEEYFQSAIEFDHSKIESLIEERNKARERKDWQEADRLRKVLIELSIAIEDGPGGTTWRKL